MLIEFSLDNCLSFKTPNSLRMNAGTIKEHIENVYYPYFFKDVKLVKSAVIYGPNASGKSNLLKAFRFMQQFVLNSSKESQASADIAIEPFRLNKTKINYPSTFEVTFLLDKTKYRYGFTVTQKEILAEWLLFTDKRKEEELYKRRDKNFTINPKLLNESKNKIGILKELTRNNSLFISVLAQFNISIGTNVSNWFASTSVIFESNTEELIDYTASLLKQPLYRAKIHEVISKSDLGFLSLEAAIKEKASRSSLSESFITLAYSLNESYQVKTSHKIYDDEKKQTDTTFFDLIKHESLGTQKYIALLGVILEALVERKILWIDELDSRFHEHLLKTIIGLFNSKINNPNGAQLICTCHNTSLLKKMLRRDQMIFAERNEFGATTINTLYFKDPGIRNDASFDKDYSSGKYGAIPKLQQLDLFNTNND